MICFWKKKMIQKYFVNQLFPSHRQLINTNMFALFFSILIPIIPYYYLLLPFSMKDYFFPLKLPWLIFFSRHSYRSPDSCYPYHEILHQWICCEKRNLDIWENYVIFRSFCKIFHYWCHCFSGSCSWRSTTRCYTGTGLFC